MHVLFLLLYAGNYTQINLDNNKLTDFHSSIFQSVLISVAGYNNSNKNYVSIYGSKENKTPS